MGRTRPMAAVPRAWRHASGVHGGLSGSRPMAEAARPASVRSVAEAARRLVLAGAARTGCTVTARVARAVARPATSRRWTGHDKVGGVSTLAQRRRRWARGKGAGFTLEVARREGVERRRRRRGGADVGEERAPVSGGAVLWLEAEAREVAAAQRQSETKTRHEGGRNFGRWRRQQHPFKGGDGDARGGGSGYSGVAWRRGERGVLARVARGRAVTVAGLTAAGVGGCQRRGTGEGEREGGGWRVGRLRGVGPSHREREGKVREGDRWGWLQCQWFRWIQTKSIWTNLKSNQTPWNIIWSKQDLPWVKKFPVKYRWKEIEIRNNSPYRNFSRFEVEVELKFREFLRVEIHWKILELWILIKFGQQAPDYTFLQGKVNFYQWRIRKLNSTQKENSDWFHDSSNSKLQFWNLHFDLGSYYHLVIC
jgi:hypothetical protein